MINKFYRILGVIIMKAMRIYLAFLILTVGCHRSYAVQDKPALSTPPKITTSDVTLDLQLQVNKDTLLKNSDEQMRITAATLLLNHPDPNARKIIIETLGLTNNIPARIAVCKALVQTRSLSKPIANIGDFIQPLFGVFATDNAEEARQAAQAILIYKYQEIGPLLEKLVTDVNKPVAIRLNAIGALQIQPAPEAAIKLLRLMDDPEKQIADEAEKALLSLGIPTAGTTKEERNRIIEEIKSKGIETYLRDLLVRQEAQIRQIRADITSLMTTYRSLLEKTYLGYSNNADKDKFLIENLGCPWPAVKLWALEKVSQRRQGLDPVLSPDFGPVLIGLISDADKDVRLKTALLLSIITEFNPAQAILARLKVETNEQVKVQLVDTIGSACYNALLPPVKITPEIRAEALDWGAKFLADQDPAKAQTGTRVIKKLLEREGLKSEDIDKYLNLLLTRYQQLKDNPNNGLRGELLSAMSSLVAQGSSCKAQGAILFEPVFKETLNDKTTDSARETAVAGLININDMAAFKTLKAGFLNDTSENIRGRIIQLVQKFGSKEDLPWLIEKMSSKTESQQAWQAVLKIFNDMDATTLMSEVNKLTSSVNQSLTAEQKIALFEKAEAKATSENKADMLKTVRERLAELYYNGSKFEKAGEYYYKLYTTAKTSEDTKSILLKVMDAYLRSPKIDQAVDLVRNQLAKSDLDTEDVLVRSIDSYIADKSVSSDPNIVVQKLSEIEHSQPRPKWQKQLKIWKDRLSVNN
jgi:HEAT repeat protein